MTCTTERVDQLTDALESHDKKSVQQFLNRQGYKSDSLIDKLRDARERTGLTPNLIFPYSCEKREKLPRFKERAEDIGVYGDPKTILSITSPFGPTNLDIYQNGTSRAVYSKSSPSSFASEPDLLAEYDVSTGDDHLCDLKRYSNAKFSGRFLREGAILNTGFSSLQLFASSYAAGGVGLALSATVYGAAELNKYWAKHSVSDEVRLGQDAINQIHAS